MMSHQLITTYFMHHRNLFYTGVTRARKSVVILGDHWGIAHCAEVHKLQNRNTFLSLWLEEEKSQSQDS